ncbi:glycosyltransferase [Curtobacterium oceanosedimentum]|uniref:glycosyltransferase n=1 Tax=Curtobacterium oceanosedimentum TaxID=465820 RepID=UPI001CE1C68F|nr:glycosyltransferase [Curtobacterium oceanosedimentum]MCA5922367.1 glycosyltransferase [Curtobacterium oceanosedimentum]
MSRPRSGTLIVKTDIALDVMLRDQLRYLATTPLAPVRTASDDTGRVDRIREREGIDMHVLPLERDPAPLNDLRSLVRLVRLMRRLRPYRVVYGTPKATLLAGIAARVCRVPVRIQVLHCLRLETTTGVFRRFLLETERLALRLATHTVAVSVGLRDRLGELGVDVSGIDVIGKGSVVGVDGARARRIGADRSLRTSQRERLRAAEDEVVVGFVGRVTRDKGIEELVRAVGALRERGVAARLALIGPDEGAEHLAVDVRAALDAPWVTRTGNLSDPAEVFAAFDVFCLPSHREGLPTVVLEAWATGIPVVATSCTGIADLVQDGSTGLLVETGDDRALAEALQRVLDDAALRDRICRAARAEVDEHFDRPGVWERCARYFLDARPRQRARTGGSDR